MCDKNKGVTICLKNDIDQMQIKLNMWQPE